MAAIDFPTSPTPGQLFAAANGVTYMYNGTLWLVQVGPPGPLVMRVQGFSASGTYTPHANMQSGCVIGMGGGGAGGAYTGTAGTWQGAGGGASGNKATTYFTRTQVVPSVAVTVGAGGVALTGGTGGTGGSTIFGSLLTATGGLGGSQFGGGFANTTGNVGNIIEWGFPGGGSTQMTATGMAATVSGGTGGGSGGGIAVATGAGATVGGAAAANSGGGSAGTASANVAGALGATDGGSGYLYVIEYCSA